MKEALPTKAKFQHYYVHNVITYTLFVTAPPPSLAVESLKIADAYRERTKRLPLVTRQEDFQACVDHLASLPGFTPAAAEAAAEFVKSELATHRHFWLRFGTSSGNYIAAVLPMLTLVMLSDARTPAVATATTSSILLTTVFALGAMFDPFQDNYQIAESLLKSAGKHGKGQNTRVPTNEEVLVQHQRLGKWMLYTGIGGIVLAGLVAFVISIFN